MTCEKMSNGTVVVVTLSIGTAIFVSVCCLTICAVIVFNGAANVIVHQVDQPKTPVRDLLRPGILRPKGAIEDIGPLNSSALNETKNGILSNIRERIWCRNHCAVPCQPCQPCQPQPAPYQPQPYQPQPAPYQPSPYQPVPITPSPITPPPIHPVKPKDPDFIQPSFTLPPDPIDCAACQKKTGGFVCAHCNKPQVGEQWHTEWMSDGNPLTFMCELCWKTTSEDKKKEVYSKWVLK